MTQAFIMEIFFRLTENIKDKRLEYLKRQSFFSRIPANDVKDVTNLFLETDVKNAFDVSLNLYVIIIS